MAAVAAEAGLSSGAVYTYVASKEALFHLVFAFGFGELGEGVPELPIATPAFSDTLELIGQGLRKAAASPRLRAALDEDAPAAVAVELTAVVEEHYATIAALWPMLAVIERCAVDLPDLEVLYFRRGRRGYLTRLTRYVEQRTHAGRFRELPDAAVTARIITEAVTWFAWHRREDRDADVYDDERARRTVVEFVCGALIEPGR